MKNLNTKKTNTWFEDVNSLLIAQRNILFIIVICLAIALILSIIFIQIEKQDNKLQPFVIEIDKKTGIPSVVDDISLKEYSANNAVQRAMIIQYIRAREEYFYDIFNRNYSQVVRVLSDPAVYAAYTSKYSPSNPNSPYNIYGKKNTLTVVWRSILFPEPNTAQIRISIENSGGVNVIRTDKIIWLTFEFRSKLQLSDNDRLINPLNFIVTKYEIEDENPFLNK